MAACTGAPIRTLDSFMAVLLVCFSSPPQTSPPRSVALRRATPSWCTSATMRCAPSRSAPAVCSRIGSVSSATTTGLAAPSGPRYSARVAAARAEARQAMGLCTSWRRSRSSGPWCSATGPRSFTSLASASSWPTSSVPGCVVLESDTGSGSLTTSLARAVAPHGRVHTFDFHEQRAASAREDFEKNGLSSLITVNVRDVQGEGFPEEHCGGADAVFLDLPQPWLAIPSAGLMLKKDGVLCSFSPCIEQVQRACEAMKTCFTDIRTFEILLRMYEVRDVALKSATSDEACVGPLPQKRRMTTTPGENTDCPQRISSILVRPCSSAKGHTGYLTFARLCV